MSSSNRIAKQHAYLRTLQLDQNVTDPKIVRKQFRKLASLHHPDRASPDHRQQATKQMQVFEEAKSWLLDHISTAFSVPEYRAYEAEKQRAKKQKQKAKRQARKEAKERAEREENLLRKRAKKLKKQGQVLSGPTLGRKLTKLQLKWNCKRKKVLFTVQMRRVNSKKKSCSRRRVNKNAEPWTDVYSGKKKSCSVNGLQPGTKYEFRLGYTEDHGVVVFEHYFTGTTLGV